MLFETLGVFLVNTHEVADKPERQKVDKRGGKFFDIPLGRSCQFFNAVSKLLVKSFMLLSPFKGKLMEVSFLSCKVL
jgi:hypothetical protein